MPDNTRSLASKGKPLPPMPRQGDPTRRRSAAAIEAEKVISPEVFRKANAEAGAALSDILQKYATDKQ